MITSFYYFIKARIARISPAYFLALILALPAFVYSAFISKIMPLNIFLPSVLLVPTFLQSWYPPVALTWNGPAWSLSVEVLFYLCFHFIFDLGRRCAPNKFLLFSYLIVILNATLRQEWIQILRYSRILRILISVTISVVSSSAIRVRRYPCSCISILQAPHFAILLR